MRNVFKIQIHVRFRDIDGMGHVNNAVFFTYFEEGRKAFFQKISTGSDLAIFPFILAHIGCDFLSPIKLDTLLSLEMWVKEIGNKSFGLGYTWWTLQIRPFHTQKANPFRSALIMGKTSPSRFPLN